MPIDEPPGAQALHNNPLLVRSHDFAGETVTGLKTLWQAPELFGEGSPAGGGAHLVGSLADLPYSLAILEQDFISPASVQALMGDQGSGDHRGRRRRGSRRAVFHAGTALRGGRLVTNGGRVLNVTAVGADLVAARHSAYAAADKISWSGARRRGDIALAATAGGTLQTRPEAHLD